MHVPRITNRVNSTNDSVLLHSRRLSTSRGPQLHSHLAGLIPTVPHERNVRNDYVTRLAHSSRNSIRTSSSNWHSLDDYMRCPSKPKEGSLIDLEWGTSGAKLCTGA